MTKTKSIKKLLIIFCIFLFAFCISLVGATIVFAADGDVNYLYCDANGANWQTGSKAAGEYTPVTSSDTAWGTSGSEAWYAASGNIEIGSRVTVNGTVNLILADDANLTINGGIAVNSGNALIIWGQSGGTGKLTANGGRWDAGIGGDEGNSGGTVTINGGTITATSSQWGAGIGGGYQGSGGTITISGGTVTATGGNFGAGIGGGDEGNGGTITISGGTVTATGGNFGAGIGGGNQGSGGTITINGGTVTATSGQWGAGIGGGYAASSNGTLSSGENGSAIVQASSINADTADFVDYIAKSGASYTVHGNVTLSADLTVAEGETLTVPEDATLTIPEGITLTNNGTFVNNGTLNCNSHSYKNGFCMFCTSYEAATPVSDTHHPELNQTHNGYYAIENAGQLYWFAQEVNGGKPSINAVLTANIVINEKVLDDDGSLVDDTTALRIWTPIGNAYFYGIFDGDGHTVSGLYGENESCMFSALGAGGTVKNVGIINSYTTYAGIVKDNSGVISGCWVANSSVSSAIYTGSIVSQNLGTVENCWSDATVRTTGYYSGGLVGSNGGVVRHCYNLGTIRGGTRVGAIVGYNHRNASVINCYFSSDNFSGDAVGLNSGSVDGLTRGMTNIQFASGEVAYLLNGDQTTITWGQNIGTNDYPVLGGAQVFQVKDCDGETDAYSNTNAPKQHIPEEDDEDCTTAILCTECEAVITEAKDAHYYKDGCPDEYCDNGICTQTRDPREHDFTGEWQSDADGHWHICSNNDCNITDTKVDHSDTDKNHACDSACGKNDMGEHVDSDFNHTCDYGCAESIGTHADSDTDTDHVCDYGCGVALENCADAENDNNHSCDICGKADVSAHTYNDATCTSTATCSECGVTTGEALGHKDDNTDHTCDRGCGKTDMGTHGDSNLDHACDYGCAVAIGTHAVATGKHTCDYCGAVMSSCKDDDENHICDICGAELTHDYSTEWKSDGTNHWHECSCGAKKDTTAHTFTETVKDEAEKSETGCSDAAVYYKSCSVCQFIGNDTFTSGEANGHSFTNYVSDNNATCTADATETAKCDHCDVTDTRTVADSATGHSFTNYVSDGNATCTADGTKTAACDGCDETDTQTDTGSKLAHIFEKGECTACDAEDPEYTDLIWLWGTIPVVIVLGGGGFALYWFVIRKKKEQ